MCNTGAYATWEAMIQRCCNPNNTNYEKYGEIGITVCPEWKDFINFYKDMGDRPEGLSLDRKDNTKGYYKENCRWATQQEQSFNSSLNVRNKSGKRGVRYIEERGLWEARLKFNGVDYIELRETFEDACKERDLMDKIFNTGVKPYGRNKTW